MPCQTDEVLNFKGLIGDGRDTQSVHWFNSGHEARQNPPELLQKQKCGHV